MNLELKKFDMSSINDDKVVVFIGKRDTGKSYLVRDLLYYHQDIPLGTVISGTEGANEFYSSIVPPLFVHEQYTPELIHNVMKRQKKTVNRMRKFDNNIDPRAFLILDDCLYDPKWVKDINIRGCFMNGRHFKLMFILTMQYALGVTPNLRTNIDYVFILRENLYQNRKKLYEHYCGMFPTFDIFCQVMDQCTENYECLVINNNAKSNKIEDQVFWYKAEPHETFRIGAEIFWKQHEANYNDSYDDDEEERIDINGFGNGKKNRVPLTVRKM